MRARVLLGVAALVGAAVSAVGAYSTLRAPGSADGAAAGPLTPVLGNLVASSRAGEARQALALASSPEGNVGDVLRRHGEAETILGRLASRGTAAARSRAANLRAALQLQDAALDPPRAQALLAAALHDLRTAIRLDQANEDAKFNLELVLTLSGADGGDGSAGDSGRKAPGKLAKRTRTPQPGSARPGTGY
ncbi:MAG TPA: hypothetical protein VFB26_06410 [Gaiellaceae bacterium]|nr:hypothetical protein [Gaiellaceae bacterium]